MAGPVEHRARLIAGIRSATLVFPGLRLGQLLLNVMPPGKDLYYVSDEELTELLRVYMVEQGGKRP